MLRRKVNPLQPQSENLLSVSDKEASSFQIDFDYKLQTLIRIMWISAFFTLLFAIMYSLGINEIGRVHATVDYGYAAFSICLALYLEKHTHHFKPVLYIFLSLCFAACFSALINVANDEYRGIWFLLLILVAFLFGGKTVGYPITLVSLLAIILNNIYNPDKFSAVALSSISIAMIVLALILATFTAQVERYIRQLDKQKAELNYLANKDPLTGVLSSAIYDQLGKKLLTNAKSHNEDLSILYADIDHFQQVNEKFGHQVGDLVLQHAIDITNSILHENDVLARIGGEEFCIILPGADELTAYNLAVKIKDAIRNGFYEHNGEMIFITMSIGQASLNESDQEMRSIQIRADKGLAKAKRLGGDMVKTFEVEEDKQIETTDFFSGQC